MKTIGYIIKKEFKQIFRNKGMLPIIFIMPLVQLVVLSNAATFDIQNVRFSYIDNDKSVRSDYCWINLRLLQLLICNTHFLPWPWQKKPC